MLRRPTARAAMRLGFGVMAAVVALPASSVETGFLNRVLVDGSDRRRYQVFVPADYTPGRRWPVILFLHGGGEQGDDGFLQTEIGLGAAIRRHADQWPAIVVFPQVRPGKRWNGRDAAWALAALDETQREFATDPDRVYLTGLSRGGAGAYYLAYRHPDRFAALLVSCGPITPATMMDGKPAPDTDPIVPPEKGGDPFTALASKLKRTPIWIFHGDADTVIPVEESRRLAEALRKAGASITYTELPGVGHGAWDAAYGREDVSRWLFAQRRAREGTRVSATGAPR
jgi:predicted peptidase